MQFGFIAPTPALASASIGSKILKNPFHLVLAHLVESDEKYTQLYREAANRSDTRIILDNSGFELYKLGLPMFDPTKLIDLGKKVRADYIVLPDYPGEHPSKTREAAIKYAKEFEKEGFGTFYVPQSEIGNLNQLIDETLWAIQSPLIDYVGISILAVPNAYGVEQKNNLQRYLSRYHFMREMNRECKIRFGKTFAQTCKQHATKIHFLGMVDGPNEIDLMRSLIPDVIVDTWDTSSPVWAGYNDVRYDASPTGLVNGKIESHVDFAKELPSSTGKAIPSRETLAIEHNIKYILGLIGMYNLELAKPAILEEARIEVRAKENLELISLREEVARLKKTSDVSFKFDEANSIKDIFKYIESTYSQHYVSDGEDDVDPVQLMDLIRGNRDDFIAFNRWNSIKYIGRWGKKEGFNRKDLLKAAHYIVLLLSLKFK